MARSTAGPIRSSVQPCTHQQRSVVVRGALRGGGTGRHLIVFDLLRMQSGHGAAQDDRHGGLVVEDPRGCHGVMDAGQITSTVQPCIHPESPVMAS
jgi:hypothetical protein